MGSRSIPGDKVSHVNSWIFLDWDRIQVVTSYKPFPVQRSANFPQIGINFPNYGQLGPSL